MKQVTVTKDFEIGPERIVETTTRNIWGGIEKHVSKTGPIPANGDYFECFLLDLVPVSPEEAFDAQVSGEAELTTDAHEANAIVHHVLQAARIVPKDQTRYLNVLAVAGRLERARLIEATLAAIGLGKDDDAVIPHDRAYLTSTEVAEIFRCSDDKVRRMAGKQLPAPMRVGNRFLFDTRAILNMLRQGPTEIPERMTRKRATTARASK